MSGACACAVDRSGAAAGCFCTTVEDTELGPRFREGPNEARGDGAYLAGARARADAEARASYDDAGAPACAMTKMNTGITLKAGGQSVQGHYEFDDSAATFDEAKAGPPRGAMTAGKSITVREGATLTTRRVKVVPNGST